MQPLFYMWREEKLLRFIHTADWHLGRNFRGVQLTEDQAWLLQDFLRMVTDSRAEAVIIAGDIYDRAVPPTEAVELFDEVLTKLLLEKRVKVFCVAGNHDSAQRVGFGSRLLAGQGLFLRGRLTDDQRPVVLEDNDGPVYFSLLPYMDPAAVRAAYGLQEIMDFDTATGRVIAAARQQIPEGARSVAVSHAFIAGGQVSESERPLSVGGSSNVGAGHFRGYGYTALGHLHNPQQAGAANIRYSGSLMKYSFDEAAQQKSLALVELDGAGKASVELLPLRPRRDVCRVQGYMADILQDREKFPISADYMEVDLLDTDAILDAYGKLKDIYPNLLLIDRPNLLRGGEQQLQESSCRNRSSLSLFADFFQEMTAEELTAQQKKLLAESIDRVLQGEREDEPCGQ